jgi:hypothetical protein
MCENDTFCRCDIEEQELRDKIESSIRLLYKNGYRVRKRETHEEFKKKFDLNGEINDAKIFTIGYLYSEYSDDDNKVDMKEVVDSLNDMTNKIAKILSDVEIKI